MEQLDSKELETLLNTEMGVEDDVDGADDDLDTGSNASEQPFDADSIRIDQQILSLKYVYELYQDNVLKLNPDFQRRYVWGSRKKKSLLIESLMLRIPIPAFYFFERNDGTFLVIDGQQRLHTIFDFLDSKFSLSGLEYLDKQCGGLKFDALNAKYKTRILRTQLAINILDERSPGMVVFDIFRRVNTGGISLNPQEMRNAICSDKVRNYLKTGAQSEAFLTATRNKVKDLRLDDQELFLRFITVYRRYDYQSRELKKLKPSKLTLLMDNEISELDKLSEQELNGILMAYQTSMSRCAAVFGKYAFVKVILNRDNTIDINKDIINKSLLVGFSVLLADPNIDFDFALCDTTNTCAILAEALQDSNYMNAITKATGDERNIKACLKYSLEVLQKCKIINPSSAKLS